MMISHGSPLMLKILFYKFIFCRQKAILGEHTQSNANIGNFFTIHANKPGLIISLSRRKQ